MIPVILKCVTSVLSAAFLLMTRPDADCVSSLVVTFVMDGVSAIGLTVMTAVVMPPAATGSGTGPGGPAVAL